MLYLELCKLLKMLLIIQERSEFGHTITEGGHAHTTDARNA